MTENGFTYRVVTMLVDDLASVDCRELHFAADGVWIRAKNGEDLFIPYLMIKFIKKVRDAA